MKSESIKSVKTILILVVLLFMASFIIILLYQHFNKTENKDYVLVPTQETNQKKSTRLEDIMQTIENDGFKDFVKFGSWPLKVEDKGRSNPFISL
ncbi:MAG: hypothetical protein ABIF17_05260 [Patescibacteria group bacterium]